MPRHPSFLGRVVDNLALVQDSYFMTVNAFTLSPLAARGIAGMMPVNVASCRMCA
jgi:hypothetical protein